MDLNGKHGFPKVKTGLRHSKQGKWIGSATCVFCSRIATLHGSDYCFHFPFMDTGR